MSRRCLRNYELLELYDFSAFTAIVRPIHFASSGCFTRYVTQARRYTETLETATSKKAYEYREKPHGLIFRSDCGRDFTVSACRTVSSADPDN